MLRRHSKLLLVSFVSIGFAAIAGMFWKPTARDEFAALVADQSWRSPASSIAYVGSAACLECHRDAASTYKLTAMSKSATTFPNAKLAGELGARVERSEQFPFEYEIGWKQGHPFVVEMGKEAAGSAYSQSEPLWLVVGSGSHARTCAVRRDGDYLFQSPVTWYRSLNAWAMSPGYDRVDHRRFSREILEDCLYCHTGSLPHVAGTRNRFRVGAPLQEFPISCERCHGPGERHVSFHSGSNDKSPIADFIVNPAKLDFAKANDVCLQCHRGGQHGLEVLRPGRSWSDFRPGMPLSAIVQRFADTTPDDSATGVHFSGKLSQLERSKCFTASPGKLHCLTCHSIHHRPTPEKQVDHYRQKCLDCHSQKGCASPESVRRKLQPDDSCVACHMPKSTPGDVPHTSITDHRIRRVDSPPRPAGAPSSQAALVALAGFDVEPAEAARNLAIAFANRGGETNRVDLHRTAISLLSATEKQFAGDAKHRLVHGLSLATLGRYRLAIGPLQQAITIDENLEAAHNTLANCAYWTGQKELAQKHIERSLAINPYRLEMLLLAGKLATEANNPKTAKSYYERALALSHGNVEAQRGLRLSETRGGQ